MDLNSGRKRGYFVPVAVLVLCCLAFLLLSYLSYQKVGEMASNLAAREQPAVVIDPDVYKRQGDPGPKPPGSRMKSPRRRKTDGNSSGLSHPDRRDESSNSWKKIPRGLRLPPGWKTRAAQMEQQRSCLLYTSRKTKRGRFPLHVLREAAFSAGIKEDVPFVYTI